MRNKRKQISEYEYIDSFFQKDALLVSMDKEQNPNVMTLAWKTIGELWHQPIISIAVAPSRYTFELLTEGIREFTLNIPSEKISHAISIAGTSSGRNTDKFKEANLKTIPGKNTTVPTIEESLLSYECKIVHSCESGNMASHHVFYGQILTVFASEDLN
ncbi:MAG: flavin reductase family protein [Promethearchaeia archaeon]